MRELKISINEFIWTVKVVNSKTLGKSVEGECLGACLSDKKQILILEDSINYEVVAHEIFHAYFSYLHIKGVDDLNVDQIEEICAELFVVHGALINKKAKQIIKQLKAAT